MFVPDSIFEPMAILVGKVWDPALAWTPSASNDVESLRSRLKLLVLEFMKIAFYRNSTDNTNIGYRGIFRYKISHTFPEYPPYLIKYQLQQISYTALLLVT